MAGLDEMMQEMADVMGASPLAVVSDDVPCAETDGQTFFFNASFMSEIESSAGEDGVRFVLAHEMGHQVTGMTVDGHTGEYAADEHATRALAQMGADFSSIAGVFQYLDKLNPHGSETHPAASTRKGVAERVYSRAPKLDEDIALEEKRGNPNAKDLTL